MTTLVVTIDGDAPPVVCSDSGDRRLERRRSRRRGRRFDGTAAGGMWTVDFTDNAGGDSGFVNGVCLVTTPIPVELKSLEVE